jgi:hypothetical protein
MQSVFRNDADLSFFDDSDIHVFDDEPTLEAAGLFPYMNINIEDLKVTGADNMDIKQVERHQYAIKLFFSNRNRDKTLIKIGDPGRVFMGLFDIYDAITAVIKKDPTFGGVVKNVPWASDFTNQLYQYRNDDYWIGRAMMMFSVYVDITNY